MQMLTNKITGFFLNQFVPPKTPVGGFQSREWIKIGETLRTKIVLIGLSPWAVTLPVSQKSRRRKTESIYAIESRNAE
jgi:hypothetical protein